MRQFSTAVLILTSLSTLNACSPRESARAGETTHHTFDFERKSGGQPGRVEIRGSLVSARGTPGPALSLKRSAGYDFKGAPGKLSDQNLKMSANLAAADVDELAAVTGFSFAQFGCATNFHQDTVGRSIMRFADGPTLDVRADLVILCGDVKFAAEAVKIVAKKVIMIDARLRVSGTSASKVTVIANDLILRGTSAVSTKGSDDMVPFGAPALSLVANHVQGLGHLNVQAEGGDWLRPDAR